MCAADLIDPDRDPLTFASIPRVPDPDNSGYSTHPIPFGKNHNRNEQERRTATRRIAWRRTDIDQLPEMPGGKMPRVLNANVLHC
uniref:Uncharacterized protein n=1 Tax=Panagrellus redivivus TaxID=6233 RepID=A0A7E4WDV6_PANRE